MRDVFGLPSFRGIQLQVIQSVTSGEDCLVVMPTGSGKSLCFQLPAVALGGQTIVVSPLIALMKDQVDALRARGVRATYINSALTPKEVDTRIAALQSEDWQLVYVAPERFNPAFIEQLRGLNVKLLVIDEAHCVSKWGTISDHRIAI
jgi:ATP-dependent DNA helicase RecQ